MTIEEFRKLFHSRLEKHYVPEEVSSFFRWLGEAYLGMSRVEISLALDKELSSAELSLLEKGLERLQQNEPIQYILGETEFYGLPFKVNRNVLIPRPETEELVEWILEELSQKGNQTLKILDIGTGSGCIAISLAKHLPGAVVTAIDVSEVALDIAKTNAAMNGMQVQFQLTDILKTEVLDGRYDLIVSNPPYVRELEKVEMKPNVLDNEPETALFVKDENPLLFYEKITKLAQAALEKDGLLFFEINQYLGRETEHVLQEAGMETELRLDFQGNSRMLKARYKP